jgi:hypothetical protein
MSNTVEDVCSSIVFNEREEYNLAVVLLAMLSWSAAAGVATLMYFNPKLKEHPGELIFLMCLCEGVAVWSTLI